MAPPQAVRLYRVYADAITAGPTFQGVTDDKAAAFKKADELTDIWGHVVIRAGYGSKDEIYWPWGEE